MNGKPNPNPVVIQVNEPGLNLIKAICNSALKQDGIEALNAVNLILSNVRGIAPPQTKAPRTQPLPEKIIPIKDGKKKKD